MQLAAFPALRLSMVVVPGNLHSLPDHPDEVDVDRISGKSGGAVIAFEYFAPKWDCPWESMKR